MEFNKSAAKMIAGRKSTKNIDIWILLKSAVS